VIDPDGFATDYEYDSDGRQTKVTDANGGTTSFAYDAGGRQTKVTDTDGDYTETIYDIQGRLVTSSRYASGATLLERTLYEYDAAGRQTRSRRKADPGGADNDATDSVNKSFYDAGGQLTKTTAPSGFDTTYAYDSWGRQTTVTLPDGSYTTSSYGLNGNLTKQIRYEIVEGSTRSFRTDSEYDCLGRATKTINQGPDGTFGNGDDQNVTYVYDGAGRQISQTDAAGQIGVTEYDALGRQTRVTEDSGGIGRVTDFAYDRAGRLVTLTAYTDGTTGPQNTIYAYNGRGLQTTITHEETGDVTMAYDKVGNMTKRTDEASVVVDSFYDQSNRLTQRKKSGSTTDVETFVYDGLGRLITARKGTSTNDDAVSRSVFAYDSLSRVLSESQAISEGTAKVVAYAYNKAGNRVEVDNPISAVRTTYDYDQRGRGTKISHTDAVLEGPETLADYTWLGNALNRREVTCDYPSATKPKFKTAFERDGILRVTKAVNRHLTPNQSDVDPVWSFIYGDLGEFDYSYDAASSVTSAIQAGIMGKLEVDRWYAYDTLNRLTTAEYADNQTWNIPFGNKTSLYAYNDLGNRLSHTYRNPPSIAYEHDKANRMTKLATKTQGYDLAGNLTKAWSISRIKSYIYKYDHNNRLAAIWDDTDTTRKAAFTYDALGRRIEHVNDVLGTTTRYYYDGVNEIVETGGSGNDLRYYVHGISYVDERLMMVNIEIWSNVVDLV